MFLLPKIPEHKELINIAFRKGRLAANSIKGSKKPKSKEVRARIAEEERIKTISNFLQSKFECILQKFPRYEKLPRFYQRLLDLKISKDDYKRTLGALKWCSKIVRNLEKEKISEIKKGKNLNASREFLGRVSSVLKQISDDLKNLNEMRKLIENFPVVEDIETLVIAGYANVGKSTFLRNLTGSKVKVAPYPFTTKDILVAYKNFKYEKYQIIDTPGLLDRPIEKRNKIEMQAILALEELANKVLFIFDPTIEIEKQISLYGNVKKILKNVEILAVINKKDISERDEIEKFKNRLKNFDISILDDISANNKKDCERIFMKIFELN
ncbi:MAG: GTPase [Candidatus Altiarchaeota archaeon]